MSDNEKEGRQGNINVMAPNVGAMQKLSVSVDVLKININHNNSIKHC